MKLNNRLAQAETRIARRQRRTLIAMQDNSDADLYHAHGVTYTLAELERLSESGWHIIRIVYADEESVIAGETRRQIVFDPTGETGTGTRTSQSSLAEPAFQSGNACRFCPSP